MSETSRRTERISPVWVATTDDSQAMAILLHDFNTEFGVPSPGPQILAERLEELLSGDRTFAVLGADREPTDRGEPPTAVSIALVTLRPNVWYRGPVAILDELYVAPHLRGRGIGSAVITLTVQTARQRGVDLIEINVDESDADAQRFYRRHGFSVTDELSGDRSFYFFREFD